MSTGNSGSLVVWADVVSQDRFPDELVVYDTSRREEVARIAVPESGRAAYVVYVGEDVVEAQGEAAGHMEERIRIASALVPRDTSPPVVRAHFLDGSVVARVHDNRTPNRPYDWRKVVVRTATHDLAMEWYGENLFRAQTTRGAAEAEVCATDAAGNTTCAPVER